MKKYWILVTGLLCVNEISQAQDNQVRGTVTSSDGEILPGVNVMIKGTTQGTSTDVDGDYSLESSQTDTLIFSFVGYEKKTIAVAGREVISVSLQMVIGEIGKLVVTAMGLTQQKEKIGYSTQQIETESLENTTTPNVANLFSGKVSGLTVNNPTGLFQSPEILLRGKEPLIVIDDVSTQTDFFDISKSDIAEINVLKGTTASALYGSWAKVSSDLDPEFLQPQTGAPPTRWIYPQSEYQNNNANVSAAVERQFRAGNDGIRAKSWWLQ